jgi:arylsulfatase A-like enzyme
MTAPYPNPINRRRFLGTSTAVAASLLGAPRLRAQPMPPDANVVLIIMEDLNDWIGCLGAHPDARTPNIDSLAARGTLFSNAHCSAPACVPSRTSFLTGRLPSNTGVYHNTDPWEDLIQGLPTLPGHLRENGYLTYQGGKIFHGSYPSVWDETFSHFDDPEAPTKPANNLSIASTNLFDWYPLDVAEEQMVDYQVTDWAIERVHQTPVDQPFFLAINYFRTHLPWQIPRKYYEQFDPQNITLLPHNPNDMDDIPQAGIDQTAPYLQNKITWYHQNREAVAAYLSGGFFVDSMLGRFLDACSDRIFDQNTLVILTSDHGFHLGEKNHWRKGTLWEESTRVPFIVIAPGVTTPATTCVEPVSLLDMFPTINSLTGQPGIPELEGMDLSNWLFNPDLPKDTPALSTEGPGNHAVRTRRWRYIRYADLSEELYDHDTDPDEWTNLAHDPQYRDLMDELALWMPDDGPPSLRR